MLLVVSALFFSVEFFSSLFCSALLSVTLFWCVSAFLLIETAALPLFVSRCFVVCICFSAET